MTFLSSDFYAVEYDLGDIVTSGSIFSGKFQVVKAVTHWKSVSRFHEVGSAG
jgi:hypothetical protein